LVAEFHTRGSASYCLSWCYIGSCTLRHSLSVMFIDKFCCEY